MMLLRKMWLICALLATWTLACGSPEECEIDCDPPPHTIDVLGLDWLGAKDEITPELPGGDVPQEVTIPEIITPEDVVEDQKEEVETQPEPTIQCPQYGSVIITEVMPNPKVVPDAKGEYFEVTNLTSTVIDMAGWTIADKKNTHDIPLSVPLRLPPRGVLLFACNGNPDENGGIYPDYVYDNIQLTNKKDSISIWCLDNPIDEVPYDVDEQWPKKEGRAMILDPSAFDAEGNDDPDNWCNAFEKFGAGDYGSPGEINEPCGINSCGDGVVQTWEECDDGNRTDGDGCESDCTITN